MGTEWTGMGLGELLDWVRKAPPGTTVPVSALRTALERDSVGEKGDRQDPPSVALTWRERLWLVPGETRIGTSELSEALGRSKHWLYRHTGSGAEDRIPHRKLDGELVFVVGELRTWLREHEEVVESCHPTVTPFERRHYPMGGT